MMAHTTSKHITGFLLAAGMALSTACCLTACYHDDSTTASELIPDITIGDFSEEGYTVTSYAAQTLSLLADVTTAYPESELTYNWYLIDQTDEQRYRSDDEEPYQRLYIGTGKALSYEVNLTPGDYTLVLEVSAGNGYLVSKTTTVHVVTNFSQGFYILKETTDGNTEMDIFNPENGFFQSDVLTATHGAPMAGKPQNLSTVTSHSYIDTQANAESVSNVVTVTTQTGDISVMRTSDLKEVLNRQNLLYEGFASDEVPYRIVKCYWINVLVTNKGLRHQYEGSLSLSSSGKYGITNGVAASPYLTYDTNSSGMFFWDATTCSICYCDYNGTASIASDEKFKINNLNRWECMHAGFCSANGNIIFILRFTANNMKQLVRLTGAFGSGYQVESMASLNGRKIAAATSFTTCYQSAAYIYGLLANGTIYAFDLETNTEQQIVPKDIPSDETITYISNKYIGGTTTSNDDYFVVGTQKGDDYTLRFYAMLGGIPDGAPIHTIRGTGSVKAMHYTDNNRRWAQLPLQD